MLDPEKLNDDQRKALKSLPSLEGVVKELEEVKKAVEVRGLLFSLFTSLMHLLSVLRS